MNARMRNTYLSDSVTTASPATLLIQLYDRLVLDLQRAAEAAAAGDRHGTNELLTHAQDIIAELHATLRMDSWSGAIGLSQIYEFALRELVRANIDLDPVRVGDVRDLFAPLRDAWREAASSVEGRQTAALTA